MWVKRWVGKKDEDEWGPLCAWRIHGSLEENNNDPRNWFLKFLNFWSDCRKRELTNHQWPQSLIFGSLESTRRLLCIFLFFWHRCSVNISYLVITYLQYLQKCLLEFCWYLILENSCSSFIWPPLPVRLWIMADIVRLTETWSSLKRTLPGSCTKSLKFPKRKFSVWLFFQISSQCLKLGKKLWTVAVRFPWRLHGGQRSRSACRVVGEKDSRSRWHFPSSPCIPGTMAGALHTWFYLTGRWTMKSTWEGPWLLCPLSKS